jgi:hypothetical protein
MKILKILFAWLPFFLVVVVLFVLTSFGGFLLLLFTGKRINIFAVMDTFAEWEHRLLPGVNLLYDSNSSPTKI